MLGEYAGEWLLRDRGASVAKKPVRKTVRKKAPAGGSSPKRAAVAARKSAPKPARRPVAKAKASPAARKSAAAKSRPTNAVASASVNNGPTPSAPVVIKPGSSGLSRKEINEFREVLLRKRAEIAGDVSTLRDEALSKNRSDAGNLSSMPIHMADLGTDNYEQEFTLGLMESERALLGEIDEALQRIKRDVYGVCAATGRPIGKARLNAKPWAKFCYEYVIAQERGHGRRA